MKSTNGNGNWKKKSATFLALALAASMAFDPMSARAAAKTVSSEAITVNTEEDTQVLVIGKTYDVDYALSTEKVTFKSSDSSIATVSKDGEVTVNKRGVVTITATTASGKKASKKFWVVGSDCSTAYQTTLDKMLESSNVNRVILRNLDSEENYVIKKADHSDKTLYVRAPLSDVKNYADFKYINLVDVADGTWREYGNGNNFKVTDDEVRFVVSSRAKVNAINLATANSDFDLEASGEVRAIKVTAANVSANIVANNTAEVKGIRVTGQGAKVVVTADGTVEKIIVDSNADVVIEGSSEKVIVEVTKNAEGAKIESSVPVVATVASNVTFELTQGAEDSTLQKADAKVAVTVVNETAKAIVISTKGSDKTETVPADTTSTPTTPGTTIPGGSVPGGSDPGTVTPTPTLKTATVKAQFSADKKTVTFTLPTAYTNIKSAKISVNVIGIVNEEFTLTDKMLEYAQKYMTDEEGYLAKILQRWTDLESYTRTDNGHTTTVTGVKGELAKKVDVDGRWATVTVDPTQNTIKAVSRLYNVTVKKLSMNQVTVTGKTNTYTVTKDNAKNQIVITGDVELDAANFVTLTVTYLD